VILSLGLTNESSYKRVAIRFGAQAMDFKSIVNTIVASAGTAVQAFEEAMDKQYKRGFADGAEKAHQELEALRRQLRTILGDAEGGRESGMATAPSTPSPPFKRRFIPADTPSLMRSPRGSVEPKVLAALDQSVKGKKPAEIAGETDVPENSVRGMLNKLRKAGRVRKQGEVWFLREPEEEEEEEDVPPSRRSAEEIFGKQQNAPPPFEDMMKEAADRGMRVIRPGKPELF
jgi:hypothetical protein